MSTGSRPSVLFPPRIVDQLVKLDDLWKPIPGSKDLSNFVLLQHLEAEAKKWLALFASRKLDQQEETPLYTEFIQTFFVGVLGYSQATTTSESFHTLRITKGKKGAAGIPDVSLGFFDGSKQLADVLAVVEIKPAGKGLSNPVHAADQIVQLMTYVFGFDCDWGIATNMQEWRLYHRSSASKYQRWTLAELAGSDPEPRRAFHALLASKHLVGRAAQSPAPISEYLQRVGADQEKITKEFYRDYREIRADCLAMLRRQNPAVPVDILIEQTQKLLDRLLFICFAEDQDLLPNDILSQRLRNNLRMVEQPKLENLRELCRAIDQGHNFGGLHSVPAYNGGLFAFDPLLDRDLRLTEQVADWALRLAKWDYYREVGVDLLGHIFEQSITDLEALRSEARNEEVKKRDSKRKREGVFYTPGYVTEYIVRHTVGILVQQARAASLVQLGLASDRVTTDESEAEREALRQHLLNWRDAIVRLRIVDPACGSGAFLLAAYKYLKDILDSIALGLEQLEVTSAELALFRADEQLLSRCLFGVDLNAESVEITKLSLWIETARKDEKLHLLDRNIYTGNSLIEDSAVDSRALDWWKAFPDVHDDGGFDCVIGNPPYVRQERISAYKEYLSQHYDCFDSIADLYTYFYELGLRLLKPGGRLGFISGGSFFRGGFGEGLRRTINEKSCVRELVSFGEYQPFEDAEMVDPSILILERGQDANCEPTQVWVNPGKAAVPDDDIDVAMNQGGFLLKSAELQSEAWVLEPPQVIALRKKLVAAGTPLGSVVSNQIYRGVLTGLSRSERFGGEGVFVIDRAKRDQLIAEDPRSADVLKPLLEGKEIKPWHMEPQDHWLVRIENRWTRRKYVGSELPDDAAAWGILKSHLPALARHLAPHEVKARKRLDQGEYWWELRSCDYIEAFESTKIVWPDIANRPRFNMDPQGFYYGTSCFFLPTESWTLLGILNSKVIWAAISLRSPRLRLRSGLRQYRLKTMYMVDLPIPSPTPGDEQIIAQCAEELSDLGARRYTVIRDVRQRLYTDLIPAGLMTGRSQKIEAWHALDFSELRTEITKRSKQDIPVRDRKEWEGYLAEESGKVRDLGVRMATLEEKLNDAVNRAFDLTEDECALVNRVLDPVGRSTGEAGDDGEEE